MRATHGRRPEATSMRGIFITRGGTHSSATPSLWPSWRPRLAGEHGSSAAAGPMSSGRRFAAPAGYDAEHDFRQGKLRRGLVDHHAIAAGQREFEAAAEAMTADQRQRGVGHRGQAVEAIPAAFDQRPRTEAVSSAVNSLMSAPAMKPAGLAEAMMSPFRPRLLEGDRMRSSSASASADSVLVTASALSNHSHARPSVRARCASAGRYQSFACTRSISIARPARRRCRCWRCRAAVSRRSTLSRCSTMRPRRPTGWPCAMRRHRRSCALRRGMPAPRRGRAALRQ